MKSLEKRANNVKNVDPSQDKGIDHAVSGANTKGKALALDSFHEMIRNAEYSYSGKGDHGNVGGRVDWDYFVSVARIGKTDIPIAFAIRTIDTDSRSQIYSIATKESPTILRGDGTQNQSANAHPSYEESSGYGNKVTPSSGVVNDEYSQNQKRTQTLTDRDVLSMAADQILSIDAIFMDAAVSDALGILIQQNLQKGMNKMSQEEKKQAEEFIKDFSKLEHGDQRYVQGWVDAKAASQQEKKEQKEA